MKRLIAAIAAAFFGLSLAAISPQAANAAETVQYTTPGYHQVNGRWWQTECEMYSSNVVRCSTDIWGPKVVKVNGRFVNHEGWVFNNLTYLPSSRDAWAGNPLASNGSWTAQDGRKWRTECDTAATGRNGCRSYATADVTVGENGRFVTKQVELFNNIVQFSTSSATAVTTVPAAVAKPAGVPVEKEPVAFPLDLRREAQWVKIAQCESNNRWNINTGNGYFGGLQFNIGTWNSVNGSDFAQFPHQATREEQITVANRLYEKRGFQPWSCRRVL